MIYYLNSQFPVYLCPTVATWVAAGNYYVYSYSSSNIWNQMAKTMMDEGTKESSILMGYIGKEVEMSYGLHSSGASTSDLVGVFRRCFDINCTYQDFSYSIVKASIAQGNPVIVRAESPQGGHSWNIDGYLETQKKYTVKYVWTCYGKYFTGKSYTEVSYGTGEYLKMNWGWDGSYNYDNYSMTYGGWNPDNSDYQSNRKIISGFSRILHNI